MGGSHNAGNDASHKLFSTVALSAILLFFIVFTATGQTIIYQCDFENDAENNNWVLENGDQRNQWYIGSTTNNGGSNGLYISNDSGTTNAYSQTRASYVYAYRDIEIVDNWLYLIDFDWIAKGENDFDLLRAFIIPTSLNPTLFAGNANGMTSNTNTIPSGWIDIANPESKLNLVSSWQHSEKELTIEAGTYKLVFFWKNDNVGGSNPPAAIDNISIRKLTCPYVTNLTVENIYAQSAKISWTERGAAENWEVIVSETELGEIELENYTEAATVSGMSTYTATGLSPLTTYYVYVRPACSADDKGDWVSYSFTTLIQDPVALPYICDFEDDTENANWVLENGDQPNQWSIGTAANNGGSNGLYISNDGGESNEYTATATSYVYACRSLEVTEAALYEVSFDWLGYGENTYDLLHAFIIPTSLKPTLSAGNANGMTGSTNTIPSGWIDIANINEELNYATTWQHSEKKMTMEAGTYYLVFFWKNNSSTGNNPPAVVDNISIVKDVPATLPYTCDFEDEDENASWTFSNLRNKWYIGTAANNGGSNGLYISNDSGTTNAYTNTSTSYVYAYRAMELTENAIYGVSFDWIANGESNYDLLRAFMVPVSLNPTLVAGNANNMTSSTNTTPSSWIDVADPAGKLNLASSWQHSEKDVPIEAGTYYLVFFWKNNNSSGDQPPAALDNISIQKSSCMPVTNITVGNITSESVTISWTEPGTADSWEVIVSETELDETELANYTEVVTVSDTPTYTATDLNLSTTYYMYVRPVCDIDDENEWTSYTYTTLQHVPATLPYTCDFEDDTENANWILVNDQINTWYIGTAANNGGSNGLYISDDGGANNEYDNGEWSDSYAYRAIAINQVGKYLFGFDWKAKGKSTYDFLKAFLIPANIFPNLTSENSIYYDDIPEGWIEISSIGTMSNSMVWQYNSKLIDIDAIGTYYLVFYWRNETENGNNPPAAIDNIEARLATAPVVVTNTAMPVDASSVRLKGSITYGGIAEVTERGFLFGSSADNLDQTLQSTDLTDDFTYIVTGLTTGETYYIKAFATNNEGTSYGNVKSFTAIDPDSYNIIYSCDFEDDAENQNWILNRPDEEYPTYWMIGNEVNNGGEKSMYVVWEYEYNDGNGIEIQYNTNSSAIAYGYREVDIPFSGEYWFKFDWKARGESDCDFVRAFIVPVELNASLITGSNYDYYDENQIGSSNVPSGWIDISEDIEMSGTVTWRKSRKKTELEAGSYYIVFYWIADETETYSEPGAVDNILVKTSILPFVETNAVNNNGVGSVILSGTLLDGGVTEVTERGFVYGNDINNLNETIQVSGSNENMTYELSGLAPGRLYYYKAYAINSKGTEYGDIKAFFAPSGLLDGHAYVDLGLPSSTMWAIENLEADSPEKIGSYFAWGETDARINHFSDFFGDYSYYDNPDVLPANADAATSNWGHIWRMPTGEEMQELLENCTWTWTKINGTSGYIVSANDNSIFLPAAGQGSVEVTNGGYDVNTNGYYWTSSISADDTNNAAALYFSADEHNMDNGNRHSGFSVRAVFKAVATVTTNSVTNLTPTSATLNGNISNSEFVEITERGFMFGTDSTNLAQNRISTDETDNFTYLLTELNINATYYYKAYIIANGDTSYGEVKSFITPSGRQGDYCYVDLGLPSGTLWATCNVGATDPEGYGGYYAWGETTTKETYTWETYIYAEGTTNEDPRFTKYCFNEDLGNNGFTDELTVLEDLDDAAVANWGEGWRMPTQEQFDELLNYCTWIWTEQNGVNGYLVKANNNNNSIFLPASGNRNNGDISKLNTYGYYWMSSFSSSLSIRARAVYFYSDHYQTYNDNRYYGYSVRPVYAPQTASTTLDPTAIHNDHGYVDLGLSVKWATTNIGATNIEEAGNYYAWGETQSKTDYDWYHYAHCYGDETELAKYCTDYGLTPDEPDFITTLELVDDAATANWGNGWRMPTYTEMKKLVDSCTWEWTERDGTYGYLVTGTGTGNSIFLPATGHYEGGTLESASSMYWTSSLGETNSQLAMMLSISDGYKIDSIYRPYGLPVRGVYDATLAMPTVSTDSVFNIATTSAYLYGTLINEDGIPETTEFGFEYGTDSQSLTETIQGSLGTNEFTVSLTGLAPNTTYYYRAYATNVNGTGYGEIKSFTTPSGTYGGHNYVDLGLPSGTLWATTNVGANSPEDYGGYYAWGETETKDEYTWSNYRYCNGSESTLTKYCNNASYGDGGFTDTHTVLDASDDAATASWGSDWRMPTNDEFEELISNCTITWTTQNSVNGRLFTGPNGNSIFLPAAGIYSDSELDYVGSNGLYWSSSLNTNYANYAWQLSSSSNSYSMVYGNRYYGQSVRPVYKEGNTASNDDDIIFQCDFEDADENSNWTLVNGEQANQWYIGSAAYNSGSNGLYISNDGGTSNVYTNNITSYVYAYRDIEFEETGIYRFVFDWRADGEDKDDLLRAFVVPFTDNTTLLAGDANGMTGATNTTPSGWIDISNGVLNQASTWQHSENEITIEAGTYTLVFFWKNDNSVFGNPPAAVDDISIRKISCPAVANVTIGYITTESATITWAERGTATNWEVIVSETELDETALENYTGAATVSGTPSYTATGLSPLTAYYVYVHAVCGADDKSDWESKTFISGQEPVSLPYTCNFEDDAENNNWTLENGYQTNQWHIGSAAKNGGENGLYISNDDGATNTYNGNSTSYVYAYRTFEVTEDALYQASFDWKATGEDRYDLLRAFIVPTSLNPDLLSGTDNGMSRYTNNIPAGWIDGGLGILELQERWQKSVFETTLEAGTYNLVFFWKNDDQRGYNPPAAIDNIKIKKLTCRNITNITVSDITLESATISWTELGTAESWNIIVSVEQLDDEQLEDASMETVASTSYFATGLNMSTTYYVYVRPVCSVDDKGDWESYTFNTSHVAATMPYTCDFEIATENASWTLSNGSQTNKWYIGTAANNGGDKGLYISNDEGLSNAYTYNSKSYVYAYRDIEFAETGFYKIAFDWKSEGLVIWDVMRAFIVPVSLNPNLSGGAHNGIVVVNLTTPTGWIDIANPTGGLMGINEWQHSEKTVKIEGGTYYLVFFWENDISSGSNPPAAVDNIEIDLLPPVATISTTNITTTSATLHGSIVNSENAEITARGFLFGTDSENLTEDLQSTDETDDFTYNNTGLTANTIYYYKAYATINGETIYGAVKSLVTHSGQYAGYYYVDLGLPSGLKWATCNVGANSLEDYGDLFAWGETEPKDSFMLSNYRYCVDSRETLTKYCTNSQYGYNGFTDGLTTLEASDDAATVNWGSGWRMPTRTEAVELINNCTATWFTINGVSGMLYVGPNGNNIFMPASGVSGSDIGFQSEYWSSSLSTSTQFAAYNIYSHIGECSMGSTLYRMHGLPVRAIYDAALATPTVTTSNASDIHAHTVVLNGTVTEEDEVPETTAYGFEYGTDSENLTETAQGEPGTVGFTATLTDLAAGTTYYYRAYATNSNGNGYGEIMSFTTLSEHNGHEYIDLGLPNGLMWAPVNVGASTPEEAGDYFAWGETTPKQTYNWETYIYAEGTTDSDPKLTKYCVNAQYGNDGFTDGFTNLLPEDDAATVNWGGEWRMPTYPEIQYLYDHCTKEWTTLNGKSGILLTGPNGNSIFLPGVGSRWNNTSDDNLCDYWSSTGYGGIEAQYLMDNSGSLVEGVVAKRYYGFPVRPVYSSPQTASDPDVIYHCDFEDIDDNAIWSTNITAGNGSQSNKWYIGTMPKPYEYSLYISSSYDGSTYDYSVYSNSSVYAYNSFEVPTRTNCMVSFDWKSRGNTETDFLRAFLVPTSLAPDLTGGTEIQNAASETPEGWIDISSEGGLMSMADNWQDEWRNDSTQVLLDAGTYYIVFYWTNKYDYSAGQGEQPPAAIDNIIIRKVPCELVTDITASDITFESVAINWTERGSAETWNIIVSDEELEDAELETYGNIVTVTDSSYYIEGLQATTTYYVYVRAVCSAEDFGEWGSVSFSTRNTPTPMPYSCGFEDEDENANWVLVNGDQTNKWYIGTVANNGGENGMYVSNDDGVSNVYTNTTATYIYAYRTLELTENGTYELSFDWQASGESSYDLLRAFIVPISINPDISAGNANGMTGNTNTNPSGWIDVANPEGKLNLASSWQHSSVETILEAGEYHLVFFWKNDNSSGNNPPAAIDNISIRKISCPSVANITTSDVTNESAIISWAERGTATSWEIVVSDVQLEEEQLESASAETVATSTYSATGLTISTTYYVYVRPVCSADEKGDWVSYNFKTSQIIATLPYTCDFEDVDENNSWDLENGTQTNKWHIGTAANNGGQKGLYISNDNGVTNAYTNNAVTYAYAYRTFEATENAFYEISFDWKATGENNYDVLRAFIVPTSLNPDLSAGVVNGMSGNTNTTPAGWIDGGLGALALQSEWQNASFETELNAGTYNLVFFWKNDNSSGSNPPAAIDNVSIRKLTCLSITDIRTTNITTSSADINWHESGTASVWEIIVSDTELSNTVLENYTDATTVYDSSYMAMDLNPSTTYYAYIRAICSDSDNSMWQSKSFKTNCDAITVSSDNPYSDNFDSYTGNVTGTSAPTGYPNHTMPDCWYFVNMSANTSAYPQMFLSASSTYAVSGNCLFFKSSGSTPAYAVLPQFNNNIENLILEFKYKNEGTTASNGILHVGIADDLSDLDASYIDVRSLEQVTENTSATVNFATETSYTGHYYIVFKYEGSSNNYYLSIDDVNVRYLSSEANIIEFSFAEDAEVPVIDSSAAIVTSVVSYSTASLNGLVPTITVSEGASINPESGVAQDFSSPVTYIVTAANGVTSREWTVNVSKALVASSANSILSFSFDGQQGESIIDVENHTVNAYAAWDYDISNIIPTITVSPMATISPASGTPQDFTNPVVYTVTAEDESSQDWTVTIANDENACPNPERITVSNIGDVFATISWEQRYLETSYNVKVSSTEMSDMTATADIFDNEISSTSLDLTELMRERTYYVYVQSACGAEDWIDTSFNTIILPATLPYTCGFEEITENNNWVLANGTQTNQWYIGTAANNGGEKGLYITNDNGVTNAYTNTSVTYVYAYRAFEVTESASYKVSFDWMANGETKYDNLRAFIVPASLNPDLSAGASNGMTSGNNTTPEGWFDGGLGVLNESSEWQSETIETIFEVGTYNIVFFWKTDGSGGSQPPAAIDNVSITLADASITTLYPDVRTNTTATLMAKSINATNVTFYYGTSRTEMSAIANATPTVNGNIVTLLLDNLSPETQYYYTVEAEDNSTILRGDTLSFTTCGIMTDDRDNTNYYTIQIGDQTWMAENLRYDGDIPLGTITTTSTEVAYRYNPNNDASNVATYGYLYNWTAAMNGDSSSDVNPSGVQGVCPIGWHLPSDAEWTQLADALGGIDNASAQLAGKSNLWSIGILTGSLNFNASGFGALPAGHYLDTYYGFGESAYFWSSTEYNSTSAYDRSIYHNNASMDRNGNSKGFGYSIRCVKNIEPTVATNSATNVTTTSATLNGSIQHSGISEITARGFKFGTNSSSLTDSLPSDDLSNNFSYNLTDLTEGTRYYYQAFAANEDATGYGKILSFRTLGAPDITFYYPTWRDTISVGLKAKVDFNGELDSYKFYIGTELNSLSEITDQTIFSDEDSTFVVTAPNLEPRTLYYAVAEATNAYGTGRSDTLSFYTYGSFVDVRDGTNYYTINIGEQIWMAENLKYEGDIPLMAYDNNSNQTTSDEIAYRYYPGYPNANEANVPIYGYLYNWPAAMNGASSSNENPSGVQGICPNGWHLPSMAEWYQLRDYIGTGNVSRLAGNYDLWQNGSQITKSPDFGESGFAAVPAGIEFIGPGTFARFRASSSESGGSDWAINFTVENDRNNLIYGTIDGSQAQSVRCVKSLPPDVATLYPDTRTNTSATLRAKVLSGSPADVTNYTFYYGTSRTEMSAIANATPTVNGNIVTLLLDNLSPETQYYYTAEITSEYGTVRGDTLSFLTYGSFTDDRDNTNYYTIQIGEQTWMAENLKYAGDEVSLGEETSETESYYYYPNGNEANVATYGYLYNWPAAMNGAGSSTANPSGVQGICPNGWHLPSDAEWTQLTNALGGIDNAGAQLAGNFSSWSGGMLTNSSYFGYSGFGALPAGYYNGYYIYFGEYDYFWSAREYNSTSAYTRFGDYNSINVNRGLHGKYIAFSVRCVKGTTIYAYDTVNYCGEQYTFGTQTLTATGDYEETFTLGTDKDSVVYLHLTMYPIPTVSIAPTNVTCNGESNGSAEVTVSVGTSPYEYAWSNNATTEVVNDLVVGDYSVTVTDANSCTATASVTISQPDELTVSLSADEILCNGQTTNIVSTIAGGTTPYAYLWSNSETTANLTDVEASVYGVTVTDANGCVATATTNITQPTALTVEISGSLSVCEGTSTTLTANVLGGTADYEYLWSNDESNATFTTQNITESTPYSVTVTDANGCTAVASVTVVIGDTPAIEISAETAVCFGNDVVLQANVSNAGTGYTVTWSASPTEGAGLLTTDGERITVTPTVVNTYTYTATLNANSCSNGEPFESTDDIEVEVNALPNATIANNTGETAITCSITEISLTATGGTIFLWSNGMSTAENIIGDEGVYTVTVTDANGCSSTTQIEISNDTDAPNVQITSDETEITCAVTEIPLQASGAVSYQWSSGAVISTLTVSAEGTYMVTGTATNGCTSTTSIDITEDLTTPNANIENITGTATLTCSTQSIEITAQGGELYAWSDSQWNEAANQTVTQAGTYIVTVTGANGCTAVSSISITQDISAPDVVASASEETICLNASTTLTATGAVTYQWTPETGLLSTNESEVTATPTVTTTYTVVGTADNGCTASAEVSVTVNLPVAYEFERTSCIMFEWNDQTFTESGNYEQTFTAANGCDSVVTLHLTINQPTESNDTVTACGSYEWNGTTYTESGNYQFTMPEANANGCDSVANLYLTINQPTESDDTVTACNSYEWYGQTYTETGDYVHTLQSVNGCDSVVNLHLIINSSSTGEFADQMCSGVPYVYEGQTYTEAGTYHVTLVNANGCDSIVTLMLTYANNCSGTITGIITDVNTDDPIPNAKVNFGNIVVRTNGNGEYSLTVPRGRKSLRVSAVGYVSYSEIFDVQSDTTRSIALYKPEISMGVDSISVTSYPYLAQYDSITITNTGNTALVWSSVSEYDSLALLPYDEETHQRRNSRALWDSIQTFSTRFNAEQAIATDGFFIYTSSWQRPGEFNRYTPDGEYIETFYIENVGMIRNLSYDGTYFYGTEATNIIFKLDLDNQTLVDSISTDVSNIRHCSFDRQNGNLLAGDWNSLYSIDTATGVSTQIRNDLMNVYSSAYDNLSPGGPYLWLFSQASQNNGPSAYIRQFSIGNADYTDKTHYLDDIGLSNSSLAGGICASEYVCEGKFVLLADIQNPSGSNIIATYEIGRTNSIVSPEQKSGRIMPNESLSIGVREHAVGEGEFEAKIRYRAAVMGNRTKDVNVTVTAVAPECDAVQQITAVTDTFYNVTLNWQPIELGEYSSVSYLIFGDNSQFAIDTTTETSITFERLSVGEHCFNVRALSVGDYSCLSESSDTVCAEIEPIPCNVALAVSASNDGESIFLTWNKPVGVEYFRIYRDDNAVEEVLYDGSYTDSNVVPEVTYCYTIFAYFEDGICNEIVGTACTKIVSGVCSESPVLQVEAVGYSVHLSWTATSESYAYKIFRNDVSIGLTTDTTYYDNVEPDRNYCYRVESLCEYGMFAYSDEECVFVELIPEDDDENGQGNGEGDAVAEWTADNLTVYPNPTYGQFFIEGQRIAAVRIYNASGQLVAEIDNNESERVEISCAGWNPGLYNVRIISEDGQVATRKISIFR